MSGGDLFGALPDHLVQRVLSFLPSRDAVKTAVLARRWRYLWSLLLFRDAASPLRSFEINADLLIGEERDEVDPHVDLWIRHAVSTCRARSLIARFDDQRFWHEKIMWSPRQKLPFASPHLTTMHLRGVILDHGSLDLPKLLHLSLRACRLNADAIVSPLLKRLHIMDCESGSPIRISTPSLRHLQLSGDHQGFLAPAAL
ncbi:F-box protein At5g03100-like [Lolium perenne]|uniref:F-box protein At5g03100-like n=1 Tax=Lolium perenne TaxID=4522 RepID=UPI003A993730